MFVFVFVVVVDNLVINVLFCLSLVNFLVSVVWIKCLILLVRNEIFLILVIDCMLIRYLLCSIWVSWFKFNFGVIILG